MVDKLDLLERIDEARANRVSPERFEQTWGYSLESHVVNMMAYIHKLERDDAPVEETVIHPAEDRKQPAGDQEENVAENAKESSGKKVYVLYWSKTSEPLSESATEAGLGFVEEDLHDSMMKAIETLSQWIAYGIKKAGQVPDEKTPQKHPKEGREVGRLLFRYRKCRSKRTGKKMSLYELKERIKTDKLVIAPKGMLVMLDFDFLSRDGDQNEILKKLNGAMPEGVRIKPIDKEMELDYKLPILEVYCEPRSCIDHR